MRPTLIALTLASSLSVPSPYRILEPLWNLLSSLGSGAPVTKAGCGMDPDGRCATASTTPQTQTEIGCGADPSGRCSSAQSEIGCGADPNGRPKCL
jgi:hypothetical protein